MDLLWSSFELTLVVFLLGAVLALVYKKKVGVTPGGIIVPGSLAIGLYASWMTPIVVVVVAMLCLGLYQLLFSRFALKQRWTTLILISMSTAFGIVTELFAENVFHHTREALLITLIAPGLIAISSRRYGTGQVLTGTLIVSSVTYVAGIVLFFLLPTRLFTQLTVALATYQPLSLTHGAIVLPISLLVAFLLYSFFGVRGGGYIVAPFVAVVTFHSPIQAMLLAASVMLSYLAVEFTKRFTLIVGLERFVFCLLTSSILVTAQNVFASNIKIEGYQTASVILVVAVAVITNDLCLRPLRSSLLVGVLPAQFVAHAARFIIG